MNKIVLGIFSFIIFSCDLATNQQDVAKEQYSFSWDFSKSQDFIYSFDQFSKVAYTVDKGSPATWVGMASKNNLIVSIKDRNSADLSLDNISTHIIKYDSNQMPIDTVNRSGNSSMLLYGMDTLGSFEDINFKNLIAKWMPIPTNSMAIGDTFTVVMEMPFRYRGVVVMATGGNVLTFEGIETVEGRTCAKLNGAIKVTTGELSGELKGRYMNSINGTASYYFDLKNKMYYGADIKLTQRNSMVDPMSNSFAGSVNTESYTLRLSKVVAQN